MLKYILWAQLLHFIAELCEAGLVFRLQHRDTLLTISWPKRGPLTLTYTSDEVLSGDLKIL